MEPLIRKIESKQTLKPKARRKRPSTYAGESMLRKSYWRKKALSNWESYLGGR